MNKNFAVRPAKYLQVTWQLYHCAFRRELNDTSLYILIKRHGRRTMYVMCTVYQAKRSFLRCRGSAGAGGSYHDRGFIICFYTRRRFMGMIYSGALLWEICRVSCREATEMSLDIHIRLVSCSKIALLPRVTPQTDPFRAANFRSKHPPSPLLCGIARAFHRSIRRRL